MVPEGIAIVADAKHPQLAKDFYEFVTSAESFQYAAKTYWSIPTRKDLDFSQFPAETDPRRFTPLKLDWTLFADSSETWMQHWDGHIRNSGKQQYPMDVQ